MATQQRLVIVDGVRTPFCKMGTALAGVAADELGATAIKALLAKTGIDRSRKSSWAAVGSRLSRPTSDG